MMTEVNKLLFEIALEFPKNGPLRHDKLFWLTGDILVTFFRPFYLVLHWLLLLDELAWCGLPRSLAKRRGLLIINRLRRV